MYIVCVYYACTGLILCMYIHVCTLLRLMCLIQISEQFRELSQRLYERPNCVEDLTEQREFVKTVPDLIHSHQSHIDQVLVIVAHLHTHIYIHVYTCLCVCPCVYVCVCR